LNVTLGPQYSEDKCGVPGFRIGDPWRWERHELLPDEKFTINLSDQLSTSTGKIQSDDELIRRALSDGMTESIPCAMYKPISIVYRLVLIVGPMPDASRASEG